MKPIRTQYKVTYVTSSDQVATIRLHSSSARQAAAIARRMLKSECYRIVSINAIRD